MKHFTIDRKTWHRGKGAWGSCLLRFDGWMCCLGHIAQQAGVPKENMQEACAPWNLGTGGPQWESGTGVPYQGVRAVGEMITVNDSKDIADTERESQLIALGKTLGWKLEFVN